MHELRGEFAIVIADERRRRLIGIRDRFGIKPLFYAVCGRDAFFASEIKALVALGVTPRWDPEAFFASCHQALSAHRTLFAGVFAVPPGCVAIAHEGRVLDHRLAEFCANIPVRHKIRGLREKHVLREAVRDHVLPEIYDRQKHPFMSPPARTADDPLAGFCQDVLHSSAVEAQPFFEPRRARSLMKHVAELPPQDRPAFEGAVLLVVSTCVLQDRFRMSV